MLKIFPLWVKGHVEAGKAPNISLSSYQSRLKDLLNEQGLNHFKEISGGIELSGGLYSFPQKNRNAVVHGVITRITISELDTHVRLSYEISMWNTLFWGLILFSLVGYFIGSQLIEAFEIENSKRFWGPVSILICLIGVTAGMYWLPVSAVRDLCKKTLNP